MPHPCCHPAGPLPEDWSALRAARSIMLQSNALNGTLPANWSRLPAIETLSLGANTLQVSRPMATVHCCVMAACACCHD